MLMKVTVSKMKIKDKIMNNNFKNFITWGAILFPVLVILNTILFRFVFAPQEAFFFVLAAAIVVSWILMLTLYYVWAIYFYNINRGWTDKDWDDHQTKVLMEGTPTEPDSNPNSYETLGLPPGTVRGTIALSVLVGGMAMLVASLAMPEKISQNEFLVDHFEYIKTAFLMVIAFYFGSKTLETISRKQILGTDNTTPPSDVSASSAKSDTTPAPVVVGDISKSTKAQEGDFNDPTAKG
jgi:hypothetical protein